MSAVDFEELVKMQRNQEGYCPPGSSEYSKGSSEYSKGSSKKTIRKEVKLKTPSLTLLETWDGKMDPTGWWVSEKFDGVRAWWNGSQIVSRQGNVYCAPNWFTANFPRTPLDGELWLGPGTFAEMSGIARGGDDKDWSRVRFLAFDVPEDKDPLEQRFVKLFSLVQIANCPWLTVVDQQKALSTEHLKAQLIQVEKQNGEGLVIRRPGSLYAGTRTKDWQRVVSVQTAEAIVTGYTKGTGNREGLVGALICRLPNGVVFKIGTGFKLVDLQNPPPIGSLVTFGYKCLTDAGVPREPRFVRIRE